MAWLYAPGLEALSSDSGLQSTDIELSVTSRGTVSQRRLSWPGWALRPWIKRLYGTISELSTADAGVELWISSLRAFRANRSRRRADRGARLRMSAGYGLKLRELLGKSGQELCCSKTRQESGRDLESFSETWPGSGLMLSGMSYQLPKRACRTDAREYSSWATITAGEAWRFSLRTEILAKTFWKSRLRHGGKSAGRLGEVLAAEFGYCLTADFGEWLMGFPKFWSDPNVTLRRIDYAAWETRSLQLLRRMRCDICWG